jgi:outer membrane receptor protein involved in Fe transport
MKQFKRLFTMLTFLFISVIIFGQGATTSGINGRIVDANGQPLAGATVVAVHVPSGTQYGALANGEGIFTIQGMRPGGPYTIEASFVGFSKKTFTDITLFLGETFILNANLAESASELGEVVVIGAKPSAYGSEKKGATINISNRDISSLPSISRSISDFTRLSPLAGGSSSFAARDGRYNNINIDGSNFNDNFGLSSKNSPGGSAEPISLDAIEEIQVNIAPYDVRQANFTGAGINAITKSGTNSFKGSVYNYFRDETMNGTKVNGVYVPQATKSSTKIWGARVGGPIIKNKLFFFLNGEHETSTTPGMTYIATRPGVSGTNVSRVPADSLQKFSDLLLNNFSYVTGPYEKYGSFNAENYKILARIDWNINKNNKFSLRYNMVNNTSDQLVNGASAPNPRASSNRVSNNAMSYKNTNYGFLNTVNSLSAELNSTFSGKFSNQLLATLTKMEDTRTSPSSIFPFIDIWDGSSQAYMSAGYELFTYNNNVLNDVYAITDNFTYYLGKHTITGGASFEYLTFGNSYMRYGTSYYRFANLQAFTNHINGGTARPIAFGMTYSYDPSNPAPVAALDFGELSGYLQDEYNLLNNLKVTVGLRFDKPLYINDLTDNAAVSALSFYDGEKLNLGAWPKSKTLASPRIGFNWDVLGNNSVKVRGGTGIFTGRLPFVFFTNQPTNSGMLQNTVELTTTATLDSIRFDKDPNFNLDATNWNTTTKTHDPLFPKTAGVSAPGSVASISPSFKMPQVWRSSLGVDIKLPLDMTLTLEGLYTKDINAIVQRNANLIAPEGTLTYAGPDARPIWNYNLIDNAGRRVNTAMSEAMVLENTNKGYSYSLTAQLAFPIVRNFNGMIGYTRSMAKDISGNPGSQAASAWSGNLSVRGQNDLDMSYSQYLTPHRIVSSLSYKYEFSKNRATTVSLFYAGYPDGSFSYRYSNDFNMDGVNGDLMYIPKDESEIIFADITTGTPAVVKYSAATQATAFWAYVAQDKYLSKHKGEYAERNGAFYPWLHRFDIKFLQDFTVMVKEKKNTLQISWDILNVGNLINSKWGIRKRTITSGSLLTMKTKSITVGTTKLTVPDLTADNKPQFQMVEINSALPTATFENIVTTSSTWGLQIGLRYIFN